MPLYRITLHLARTREFPNGNWNRGYVITAPLDENNLLDPVEWAANKEICTAQRSWDGEETDLGHLVHRGGAKGGSWAFHYDIAGDEDDEAGFRFGAHSFNVGEYVSIRDDDGHMHTFEVAVVEPI